MVICYDIGFKYNKNIKKFEYLHIKEIEASDDNRSDIKIKGRILLTRRLAVPLWK